MISLQNVTKAYATPSGEKVILDDVTFTFESNVNVGVLGRNGAGKSTLLRLLAGIELPDMGEVNTDCRVSWPLGFSGGFSGALSGVENSRFVARIYGQDVERVVAFAEDFCELGEFFYMPVRTYSSGMKARLAFGLSMAVDFHMYLVDEITAVGDAKFQAKSRAAFQSVRDHASLIMVSHSLNTIRDYCDRCVVLHNGRLRQYDSVNEAEKAYLGAIL